MLHKFIETGSITREFDAGVVLFRGTYVYHMKGYMKPMFLLQYQPCYLLMNKCICISFTRMLLTHGTSHNNR